jgi:hypothetical protein
MPHGLSLAPARDCAPEIGEEDLAETSVGCGAHSKAPSVSLHCHSKFRSSVGLLAGHMGHSV